MELFLFAGNNWLVLIIAGVFIGILLFVIEALSPSRNFYAEFDYSELTAEDAIVIAEEVATHRTVEVIFVSSKFTNVWASIVYMGTVLRVRARTGKVYSLFLPFDHCNERMASALLEGEQVCVSIVPNVLNCTKVYNPARYLIIERFIKNPNRKKGILFYLNKKNSFAFAKEF